MSTVPHGRRGTILVRCLKFGPNSRGRGRFVRDGAVRVRRHGAGHRNGPARRGEAMERDVARCLGNLELGI